VRTVVAALLWDNEKILVCQRRKWDTFGLLWEFPGGKLEPGESPADGLVRELREELAVEAQIGEEVYRTRHTYAKTSEPLELIFFRAEADARSMKQLAFEQMRWLAPADLSSLEFLPADREIVRRIAQGEISPPSDRR